MATRKELTQLTEQIAALTKRTDEGIKAIQSSLTDFKKEIQIIQEDTKQNTEQIQQNKQEIERLSLKIADLSDRARRKNLRVSGIASQVPEGELKEKLTEWITSFQIQMAPGDIQRAHRAFRGREPKQVIVSFAQEEIRDRVFKTLRSQTDLRFQGSPVYIKHDLSAESLKAKSLLQPYAQRLYDAGQKFSWCFPLGILVYKDTKKMIARTPSQARDLLKKLGIPAQDSVDPELEQEGEGSGSLAGSSASMASTQTTSPSPGSSALPSKRLRKSNM